MSSMEGTARSTGCAMSDEPPGTAHLSSHDGRAADDRQQFTGMKVALTVNDFLRRAELIYPNRQAIVDEPAQPAESWGTITYAEMAARARAQAAALDSMGIGVGERVRHRQPQLGPPAHCVVRCQRQWAGARADQLPPCGRRSEVHRRTFRRSNPDGRSGTRRRAGQRELRAPIRDRCPARRTGRTRRPTTVGVRRGRHRNDQLHQRHDCTAERRAADASQHLAERHDIRLAARHQRSRRLSAHASAVPLQRLGHALRGHGDGRPSTSSSARSTAPRSSAESISTASR